MYDINRFVGDKRTECFIARQFVAICGYINRETHVTRMMSVGTDC